MEKSCIRDKHRGSATLPSLQVEYIHIPIEAVDTHRPRPSSPTRVRNAFIDLEKALELSDRTAAALSIGEGDKVVKTVGGPQFRFTNCDTQDAKK
jgi:hypothetical protein